MAKKKQKLDTINDEQQKNVKVYISWGMPNVLPVFPDGEDEEITTNQDHSEGLRQKARVSKKKKKEKARYSYHYLLITDMEKLSKVIDLYPILCDGEQVCCECKT